MLIRVEKPGWCGCPYPPRAEGGERMLQGVCTEACLCTTACARAATLGLGEVPAVLALFAGMGARGAMERRIAMPGFGEHWDTFDKSIGPWCVAQPWPRSPLCRYASRIRCCNRRLSRHGRIVRPCPCRTVHGSALPRSSKGSSYGFVDAPDLPIRSVDHAQAKSSYR